MSLHKQKVSFLISAIDSVQFPNKPFLPEIAFVGRSNVGKSSLLNHLTKSSLAKVSTRPGKTKYINFFSWNEKMILVDLPGYGFSKVTKILRKKWASLIEQYLQLRKNLTLILFLIDLRHPPTEEDIVFAKWASHFQKPLLIVFTKADKLSSEMQKKHLIQYSSLLKETLDITPMDYISYSIKNVKGRTILLKKIEQMIL